MRESRYEEIVFRICGWTKQQGKRFLPHGNLPDGNVWIVKEEIDYEHCSHVNRPHS